VIRCAGENNPPEKVQRDHQPDDGENETHAENLRGYATRAMLDLSAVVTDGFDRAAFHRFLAKTFLLGRLGLLVNERMTAVIVPFEIGGRGFTAEIAIDALLIDIELSGGVFRIFVGGVGHKFVR
jgi:hypothetical protein